MTSDPGRIFCLRCGQHVKTQTQLVTLKNGKQALQGTCPRCGCRVSQFVKAS